MRKSLIATFVCSVMALNMFQFPVMAETLSDVDLKADKTKVRIDEENKSILFTTSPVDDFEGESVSLVYASTGEKVADLHDDGGFRFEGDGDTYMNDSCYSNYLDFSDKEIGDYTYYVTYTDINGIARKSEDITVHIYRGFTDQELADMEAIQNAINELLNSEEFKNSTPDKRFELAENLLNDLKEKDLIISYEKSPYGYQIDYVECTGTLGVISESVFIDYDKPIDGGNADNIFELSCDTKKICVDYSAEKENKNVFFTADCEDEVSGVELFDADTNEKITVLYDDGNVYQNGDVYMNDGVYSNYFNMEDKPIGTYQFYAQYTDAQGEVHTSNTVKIGVYRLFTDQELADMEAIQNAIEELLNSEEFKNSIPDKRFELAENLLNDLKEKDLIISYEKSPYGYQIDYVECTGTLGVISESVFIDYDKPVDSGETYTVTLKLNGYSRNAEYFLDEENRDVIFSATCIKYNGNNVELVDAETDEVISTMLDDGDFENSGDDLDNDGTWCTKLNFDNKGAGEYSYYARITDENGNIYKTKTLSVVIFDTTTEDMMKDAEANQKIADLQNSDEFKSASLEERKVMAEKLLNSLVDEGYINDGSIEYPKDGLFTWLFTATGIKGYFDFSIHDHENKTTTSSSSTTTTTVTTTITAETNTEQTTEPPATDAGGSVTTETSTVPPTTTGTETTLPQTGYSKWYQALIAAAMGMIGVGSTAIVRSGIFRKKENNS